MAYPGYGAPQPGNIVAASEIPPDPFYQYFSQVAGADNEISVSELQRCLNSIGWCKFSVGTCRTFLSMLDRDFSGQMGYEEFKEVWSIILNWRETFVKLDTNRSGRIEAPELHNAFRQFGYNISPQLVSLVIYKFDFETRRALNLDQFISACMILRGLTEHFRRRDTAGDGHAKFLYDNFMQVSFMFAPV